MTYAKKKRYWKTQYLHILEGEKKTKWPFFSLQQYCRYCSLVTHGRTALIVVLRLQLEPLLEYKFYTCNRPSCARSTMLEYKFYICKRFKYAAFYLECEYILSKYTRFIYRRKQVFATPTPFKHTVPIQVLMSGICSSDHLPDSSMGCKISPTPSKL